MRRRALRGFVFLSIVGTASLLSRSAMAAVQLDVLLGADVAVPYEASASVGLLVGVRGNGGGMVPLPSPVIGVLVEGRMGLGAKSIGIGPAVELGGSIFGAALLATVVRTGSDDELGLDPALAPPSRTLVGA